MSGVKVSEIVGTVFVIIAAFLVSSKNPDWGLVIFLISNISFIYMGIKLKLKWFILAEITLIISNIYGIINYFIL